MKITVCGSIAFHDEMLEIKERLEKLGHEVMIPPTEVKDGDGKLIPTKEGYRIRKSWTRDDGWVWERKQENMVNHFQKVGWSEAILVLNFDKEGKKGYVGGNTFLEMGVAFFLGKGIFLMNPIPALPYKEEILGMRPVVIEGDLERIK